MSKLNRSFLYIFFGSLLAAVALAAIIYPYGKGLDFCRSRACFDYFVEYFELPIQVFMFSITLSTVLFSLYRVALAQKNFELQSKSFLHNAYQTQIDSLQKFLQAAEGKNLGIFGSAEINIRKFFDFLYPYALLTGDFHDETEANNQLRSIIDVLKKHDNRATTDSFDPREYQEDIEIILKKIGVDASIEDSKSALDSEEKMTKLLGLIAQKWLSHSELDFESEHYAHHHIL